jgi:Glyoxalase-like domain
MNNPFILFNIVKEKIMTATIRSITFDCANPLKLAHFWAGVIGSTVADDSDDEDALVPSPDGHSPRMLFIKVPEGKAAKNRIHFDLIPATTMAEEVERLLALGAQRAEGFDGADIKWTVLQDPEGNEFCVEHNPNEPRG